MPKFGTIFRMIVMVVAAVVAVEGWQRYGPSKAQVKSLATRALEIAHESLNRPELKSADSSGLVASQPGAAPIFSTTPLPGSIIAPPVAPDDIPPAPEIFAPAAANGSAVTMLVEPPAATAIDTDRLPALMNRLEQLGGIEPQLVAWGNSGQLYRFCCQATLSDVPNVKRHFESVAGEPVAAVEEVVAKLEKWRTAEQDRSHLR